MTANQFFVPRLAKDASRIVLRGEEHRHLAKAARVRCGEMVWLSDGGGSRCLARVEAVAEDRTELAVLRMEEPESVRTKVVLAPCLIEAKRLETVLEKAAELGCAEFAPVVSARSLRASAERAERKLERWGRIAREAAKQSKGGASLAVRLPRALRDLLREPPEGLRLFLSEHGGRPLRDILTAGPTPDVPPAAVVVLVGPTGGWTEGEEKEIRRAGFEAVSLGRRILKSDSAALAAAAMIVHFWNG